MDGHEPGRGATTDDARSRLTSNRRARRLRRLWRMFPSAPRCKICTYSGNLYVEHRGKNGGGSSIF